MNNWRGRRCLRCHGASRDVSGGAGVLDITANDVVVKVGLWNLLPGVYCHLPGPHSRKHTAAHEATSPEADV